MDSEDDYSSDEDIHVGLGGGLGFKRKRDGSDASDGAAFRQKVSFNAGGVQVDDETTENAPPENGYENGHSEDDEDDMRPSFGGFRSMLGGPASQSQQRNHRPNTKVEAAHTSKYGIGAKLLGKMGYVPGQSLGNSGRGLVEPIEQKVRPSGLGLGGINEKTSATKREEKRRTPREKTEKGERALPRITTRPKNIYKTIDEMEAEGLHVPPTLRSIIDMSQGAEGVTRDLQEVRISEPEQSGAESDTVSLLYSARTDLESFHKEWQSLQARKKYAQYQTNELEMKVDEVMRDLKDMKSIIDATERLYNTKRSQLYSVDAIAGDLDTLQYEHINDLQEYGLDEVAVSSLAPLFEKAVTEWDPLDEPVRFREHFLRWKLLLRINKEDEEDTSPSGRLRKQSTPYESLMYHIWLPKVQSVLTNSWDITKPASVLLLLEEWVSVLPPTVKHTLLQRVVIPKLKSGIATWSPAAESSLHSWLFPWIPYLGDEMQELLDEVKLKFVTLLRHWRPSKGSPIEGIDVWRELFGSDQLDNMLTSQLLPRLFDYLRKSLVIDPAKQNVEPLEHIMGWSTVLRPTLIGHLLEDQFFPKWMEALHSWLVLADADLGEVYTWFQTWSDWFKKDIRQLPQVSAGFRRGLDLINTALDLGDERHTLLLPGHEARAKKAALSSAISSLINETSKARTKTAEQPDRLQSSFKDVVEEYCVNHELFLVPLRRAHDKLGHALYKISRSATGSGGYSVYFDDDVLWIQIKNGSYEPISLDDLGAKMGV